MKIVIVGGGEMGHRLVNSIDKKQHEITVVESDPVLAKKVADTSSALVLQGDGTDVNILSDAGIAKAMVVIATTSDDKSNLMICEIAKSCKVKKIIARVNKSDNVELFSKLGITAVINVPEVAVHAFMKLIESGSESRILSDVGKGRYQVFTCTIAQKSKMAGKSVKLKNARVCAISRNGKYFLPEDTDVFEGLDHLVICSESADRKSITKMFAE